MYTLIKNAPARFYKSLRYALRGLRETFRTEDAFKLETLAFVVLLAVMAACPWPAWKKLAMIASYLLIPLVELLNSAVEDVCDRITRERDEQVRNAKDKGAMAVLMAIVINAVVLAALLAV